MKTTNVVIGIDVAQARRADERRYERLPHGVAPVELPRIDERESRRRVVRAMVMNIRVARTFGHDGRSVRRPFKRAWAAYRIAMKGW